MSPRFFFAEKSVVGRQGEGAETWHCDGVHLWAGPIGLHLYWRFWQSRFDHDPCWDAFVIDGSDPTLRVVDRVTNTRTGETYEIERGTTPYAENKSPQQEDSETT